MSASRRMLNFPRKFRQKDATGKYRKPNLIFAGGNIYLCLKMSGIPLRDLVVHGLDVKRSRNTSKKGNGSTFTNHLNELLARRIRIVIRNRGEGHGADLNRTNAKPVSRSNGTVEVAKANISQSTC